MNTPRIERNPVTGILEALIPATLIRIPDAQYFRTNVNGTKFAIATAEVVYPDGSKEQVNGALWENSIGTELYKEGMAVQLRTQLEGAYAGNAVVQLPGAVRVDISKFDFTAELEKYKAAEANAVQAKA